MDELKSGAPRAVKTGRRRRRLGLFLLAVALLLLLALGRPLLMQDEFMYFPRRYASAPPRPGSPSLPFAPYTTADGRTQWGYRIEPPPGAPAVPEGLPAFYLVFYGNASLAEEMAPVFDVLARETGCGFFIVDYRGYGFNEGKPSERGMTDDAIGAYDTLKSQGDLDHGAGVIGHSMGAAAALALAEARPVDRLALLSPFTSVRALARAIMPWPLAQLARNDWPNDRRLAAILHRPAGERPAAIGLIHGERDEIIPASMSRTLAALPGGGLELKVYDRAMHNDIFDYALDDLARFLRGGTL